MKTSNPLRKLIYRHRKPSPTKIPPAEYESYSRSSTDSSFNDPEDVEVHRQQALAEQDSLLPHLLAAVKDYQLTHGSLIKLVSHPETYSLPIPHTILARPIGVSLVPTLFPRERYEEAWELQLVLQELYAGVAGDVDLLRDVLRESMGNDSNHEASESWSDGIVSGLWDVYKAVRDDPDGLGYVQDIEIGLCRGDWMLSINDENDPNILADESDISKKVSKGKLKAKPTLKQVELNAIATAGASHSDIVSNMHHHLLRTGIYDSLHTPSLSTTEDAGSSLDPTTSTSNLESIPSSSNTLPSLPHSPALPTNTPIIRISQTLSQAHSLYGHPKSKAANKTAILMVVQPNNVNIADERPVEYALWDLGIPCFRCEYQDILSKTWFSDPPQPSTTSVTKEQGTGRELLFHPFPNSPSNPYEISLVYLRSSLDISELRPGRPLLTRLHLECSRAIKCPSVLGQLAASKRVQQYLSMTPGVMERYITSENAERVRGRSVPMESLGDEGGEIRKILDGYVSSLQTDQHPTHTSNPTAIPKEVSNKLSKYVLKPISAEGGSHCIFGTTIADFYAYHIFPNNSQAGYILMQRIHPPVVRGALISQRGLFTGEVVSELGILGGVIFRHSSEGSVKVIQNTALGHTLKSKPQSVPEMSVIKGYGCFDTPCLVEWEDYLKSAAEGIRPVSEHDIVG